MNLSMNWCNLRSHHYTYSFYQWTIPDTFECLPRLVTTFSLPVCGATWTLSVFSVLRSLVQAPNKHMMFQCMLENGSYMRVVSQDVLEHESNM